MTKCIRPMTLKEPRSDSELFYINFLYGGGNESRGKGICRYCGHNIKLLKSGKHVKSHYMGFKIKYGKCEGSRRLDYKNRNILLISENLDRV